MMKGGDKIYIAGHRGMVGSAILRRLQAEGYSNIVTRSSEELDLRKQQLVDKFFSIERPKYVFLAAAKVGGIAANNAYRAEFLYDNLMIQANVINAAHRYLVEKLLFLGSSCIYPKFAAQPLVETALFTGPLEETNRPYAIAKIAGIEMCDAYRSQYGCNFISLMPTNLYGPNDNYNPETSHVLPALLQKMIAAKKVGERSITIWGTGTPRREFLHVDDLANACYLSMQKYDESGFLNVGTGVDISILELAHLVKRVVGFTGTINTDPSMPDGTPRKLMDISRIHKIGWHPTIALEDGIKSVYDELSQHSAGRLFN